MTAATPPLNESERLANLQSFGVLDSPPQKAFDAITALASSICGTPIALISLVDQDRQWFKSKVGLDAFETPREDAFCAHAILKPNEVMLVEDAWLDPRFRNNPLVLHEPDIRFYAGAPIVSTEGFALGTVCVIDSHSRTITLEQQANLRMLAKVASNLLEHQRLLQIESRRASLQVKSQQAVTDAIINTGRDLSTFIDPGYHYRHVNAAYLAYWSMSIDQIIDQPVRTVVGEELFDQTIRPHLDRALLGEDVHFEKAVHFKGRGLRHMEVSYLPARGETGEVIGVVVRAHDAQERKERDDQLRNTVTLLEHKTVAQDRFIHIVSHDLREPINTINNFASLLMGDESLALPAAAQRYLSFVSAGGRRMEALLEDLLNFLQLEHHQIKKLSVDLTDLARQVRDDLSAAMERSQGEISFASMPVVYGDPSLLRIALQNLVANGLKFVEADRKPIVTIKAETDGVTCCISVSDNGVGIDQDQLEKIFDLFQRLHSRKKYAGTGLGLSISRRIAELHDGEIQVTSVPGQGSCFTLVLPVLPVQPTAHSQGD